MNKPKNSALKDALVIIHASDLWLDKNMSIPESCTLKKRISKRVNEYLKNGKRVFYTPYQPSETEAPDYLENREYVEFLNFEENIVPAMMLLKFQAILIKDMLLKNSIDNVEL